GHPQPAQHRADRQRRGGPGGAGRRHRHRLGGSAGDGARVRGGAARLRGHPCPRPGRDGPRDAAGGRRRPVGPRRRTDPGAAVRRGIQPARGPYRLTGAYAGPMAWLWAIPIVVVVLGAIALTVYVFNRDLTSGGPRATASGGSAFGALSEVFDPGAHRAQMERERLKHQVTTTP